MIFSFTHAIILGIIEGFTEFLPISSTAHLVLAAHIIGLDQSIILKTFEIAIQSGAIFAVLFFFWRKFLDIEILKRIIIAFIPTAIIGLLFYKIVKNYLIGNLNIILISLAIGGLIIILFEKLSNKKVSSIKSLEKIDEIKNLSYKKLILIGIAQSVAIIPGVSRSAATIIGGMFLGLSREAIVEFSFLLAVPTILSATGLDLIKNYHSFSSDSISLIVVGFITSFITAIIGIKFFMSFIKTRSFVFFGIYRIAIVIMFISFLM